MHSPKSTSMLYTPPADISGRLYPFCEMLKERFVEGGFMVKEERGLKLHATVLNTVYAGKVDAGRKLVQGADGRFGEGKGEEEVYLEQGEEGGGGGGEKTSDALQSRSSELKVKKKGKRKEVVKFDARELVERYEGFEWAKGVRIERVAICEMGAKKIKDEKGEVIGEEYTEVASVALP
ncbi:MAG: hypothetical protein Q9169_006103 [Polycauliona sp. 2 TL-2023]